MMRHANTALLALLLVTAMACAGAPADFQPTQLRNFPRGTLAIETAGGRQDFTIWIADSGPRQEQGLMWIRDMPADYGMVFPLLPPRTMNMWMKNTFMPLDMLFYDRDGRITHIEQRTTPLSEDIIESGGVVAGVVELLGGEVARRNIKLGDRVVVHGVEN
jgi:uncharacterized membrane protein (UPF0127 family)